MKCGRQVTSRTTRRVRRCWREATEADRCWQHQPETLEQGVHYDQALSLLVSEPVVLAPFAVLIGGDEAEIVHTREG